MDCFFTLPSAIILKVSGPDAPRYLNARLTNDIRKLLKPDRALLAAALTPQGRTQGLFVISGDVSSEVLLASDDGIKDDVIAAFRKYIVADRVQVADQSQDLSLMHVIGPAAIHAALFEIGVDHSKFQEFEVLDAGPTRIIGRLRSSDLGVDILLPKESLIDLTNKLKAGGFLELSDDQRKFRLIAAGIPTFPDELNEEMLFSESGLLEAISFNKGCYTGQEVVEKVDSLGKLSKVLRLIRSVKHLPVVVGDQVYQKLKDSAEGPVVGKVISLANDPASGVAVCFIQLKSDPKLAAQNVLVRGNEWEVVDPADLRSKLQSARQA